MFSIQAFLPQNSNLRDDSIYFKGTVIVISSGPQFKDGNVWFKKLPLKPSSDLNVEFFLFFEVLKFDNNDSHFFSFQIIT